MIFEAQNGKGENDMVAAGLGSMFLFYTVEFICIVAVAVAGVFVGKKIRDNKDKKKENIGE